MYYACVHYLTDFVRASAVKACHNPACRAVKIVEFLPPEDDAKTIACIVDAPSREAFFCWVTAINAGCRKDRCHPVPTPEAAARCLGHESPEAAGATRSPRASSGVSRFPSRP